MRKLVVRRRKTYVASLVKVRICMKTELQSDIKLVGTNLKVLGELSNGHSLEVEIPEEELEIYVVFDKVFPQRFHSKCTLEAGVEDEVLYTFPALDPFAGNPFAISKKQSYTRAEKRRLSKTVKSNIQSDKNQFLFVLMIVVFAVLGAMIGWNLV